MGKATALAFAREGAKVVIASRRITESLKTVDAIKALGGDAVFFQTDISKEDQVQNLIHKTMVTYSRLDFAYNNAGAESPNVCLVADKTSKDFDLVINVNLKGTWLCLKYELLQMTKQKRGVIVNCSSMSGLRVNFGMSDYCASKFGVIALTQSAALEYASKGIRVNAVCPGFIRTPMLETALKKYPKIIDHMRETVPMGRIGNPEDIAETVLWLCSDSAAYITGQAIVVDGGKLTG